MNSKHVDHFIRFHSISWKVVLKVLRNGKIAKTNVLVIFHFSKYTSKTGGKKVWFIRLLLLCSYTWKFYRKWQIYRKWRLTKWLMKVIMTESNPCPAKPFLIADSTHSNIPRHILCYQSIWVEIAPPIACYLSYLK